MGMERCCSCPGVFFAVRMAEWCFSHQLPPGLQTGSWALHRHQQSQHAASGQAAAAVTCLTLGWFSLTEWRGYVLFLLSVNNKLICFNKLLSDFLSACCKYFDTAGAADACTAPLSTTSVSPSPPKAIPSLSPFQERE